MRIKEIELSWFRGAAERVSLETACKSVVVYGVNGAGKSSFVDAVEYIINDGKVGHLSHEYSGKRQEKAVFNTHKPASRKASVSILFRDDSQLRAEIDQDGSASYSGADAIEMRTWDYRLTVLRQDELATFIRETKGGKYSVLLPLLGLHDLEVAAENLHGLAKAVEAESQLRELKGKLNLVATRRLASFGSDGDEQILLQVQELHRKYSGENAATEDPLTCCRGVLRALEARSLASSAEQSRHYAFLEAASLEIKKHVDTIREENTKLAEAVEPLVAEKLAVLESTGTFIAGLADLQHLACPACGRLVPADAFTEHVVAEGERLKGLMTHFKARRSAVEALCVALTSLKGIILKADVKPWCEDSRQALASGCAHLDAMDVDAIRVSCGEQELRALEVFVLPLLAALTVAAKDVPPDVRELIAGTALVNAAILVFESTDDICALRRGEALVRFVKSLEQGIREEIKVKAESALDEISADVRSMWEILNPGKAIENLRLYFNSGANKAIDISLKFHGVEQESPRLTLSEGYRNGLGLCIFLATAKRQADKDRPLLLDDVVVSLDRHHRGMVAELLDKEFSARQLLVLTHDREWYTELRQQLDAKAWVFKALLPYETPEIGIRWAHSTSTFGDARSQLQDRPDSAGNDARKIMDVELALLAERLQIRVAYLRAEKNDRRTAHEFMERFIADGKKCFQRQVGNGYEPHTSAIELFERADRLLVSWGNRASHSFDVEQSEARKTIDACEKAIEVFNCTSCGKRVWFANVGSSEFVQCGCGQIRWRYGKG